MPGVTALPTGFRAYVANVGIKDTTDDFVLVATDAPCTSVGMFTTSSFAGPSVLVSREHLSSPTAQAVVVISKNANVATGVDGLANAREVVAGVATAIGCDVTDVLIASTGVIGRQYPMDRVRAGARGDSVDAALHRRRPGCGRDHDHRHRPEDRRGRRSAQRESSASPRASG